MHNSSLNDHLGREQIENCIFRSNLADMMKLLFIFSALWAQYCFHSCVTLDCLIIWSTNPKQVLMRSQDYLSFQKANQNSPNSMQNLLLREFAFAI